MKTFDGCWPAWFPTSPGQRIVCYFFRILQWFYTPCGVRKKSIDLWNCFGLFAGRSIGKTQLQGKKEQPKVIFKLFFKNFITLRSQLSSPWNLITLRSLFSSPIFKHFWWWVVVIWLCETFNTYCDLVT